GGQACRRAGAQRRIGSRARVRRRPGILQREVVPGPPAALREHNVVVDADLLMLLNPAPSIPGSAREDCPASQNIKCGDVAVRCLHLTDEGFQVNESPFKDTVAYADDIRCPVPAAARYAGASLIHEDLHHAVVVAAGDIAAVSEDFPEVVV